MRHRGTIHAGHPWGQYLLVVLALVAGLGGLLGHLNRRSIEHPPGQIAPAAPRQHGLDPAGAFDYGGYLLTPRATFELEARILSTTRYRFDPGAGLAPYDFALGWGEMSDSDTLAKLEITQGSRFYTIYPQAAELDLAMLLKQSSNMHLIPANDAVERVLASARVGHVVGMKGRLVDANRSDGYVWRTSLSRNDTGAGACELVFVEAAWLR